MSIIYTNDKSLENNPTFKKIKGSLETLFKSTGHQFFFGNCVSSCDIIQQVLSQEGIKSKILECQLSIIKTDNENQKQFFFIGYDGNSTPGQIDTHTILLVEDDEPILIDISIGQIFLPDNRVVVEKISSKIDSSIIAEYIIGNLVLSYKHKHNLKLPSIHQKNLVQRIIFEQDNERSIKFLKKLIIAAVAFGLFNFTLNLLLIWIRLYDIKWV